jgi:hypothetical protein
MTNDKIPMKQRIVISGRGGQGILTLTRVLAEAAAAAGHHVITSETHGMAQPIGTSPGCRPPCARWTPMERIWALTCGEYVHPKPTRLLWSD